MVVEEDIGPIIIRLKCQIKILETTVINNKKQEVQGQPNNNGNNNWDPSQVVYYNCNGTNHFQ